METAIIKTTDLHFAFNKEMKALDDVNLVVPKGSIYGFLGPNGAGKTTTLRLLLGLLKIQKGSIEIFGQNLADNRIGILKRLGSLIEQPSLYAHLTARENLEIYRRIYDCDKKRIEEVLAIVKLSNTAKKKVKQFSLGMKQRLSIAIALLPNPELLILDEPTNGLDPVGIIETRELIRQLNREEGTTILVSSHILNEVEKMATHLGIIHKGNMLFQGTLPELHQLQVKKSSIEIKTNDNLRAIEILGLSSNEKSVNGHIKLPFTSAEEVARMNRLLVQHDIDVYALYPRQNDLEDLFIDLTKN